MPDTFGSVWRAVRLHAGDPPANLCIYWAKQAWRRLCDRRGTWSFLRAETQFLVSAQKTGTVVTTQGSATVQAVGLVLAATDTDRQFRIAGGPVYSIEAIDLVLNTITLDRVYGDTGGAATAQIFDAYVTCPADFGSFMAVLDEANWWQLHYLITQDELNLWDPRRQSTGTAWALAARRLASTTGLNGRTQYELWPYMTSAHQYHVYYWRRPDAVTDEYQFEGVLADRSDILVTGALAECAMWPGTTDRKNPYFNLAVAREKKQEFLDAIDQLELRDEEVYLTWLQTVDWVNRVPWAPYQAAYLRTHDFSYGG